MTANHITSDERSYGGWLNDTGQDMSHAVRDLYCTLADNHGSTPAIMTWVTTMAWYLARRSCDDSNIEALIEATHR